MSGNRAQSSQDLRQDLKIVDTFDIPDSLTNDLDIKSVDEKMNFVNSFDVKLYNQHTINSYANSNYQLIGPQYYSHQPDNSNYSLQSQQFSIKPQPQTSHMA